MQAVHGIAALMTHSLRILEHLKTAVGEATANMSMPDSKTAWRLHVSCSLRRRTTACLSIAKQSRQFLQVWSGIPGRGGNKLLERAVTTVPYSILNVNLFVYLYCKKKIISFLVQDPPRFIGPELYNLRRMEFKVYFIASFNISQVKLNMRGRLMYNYNLMKVAYIDNELPTLAPYPEPLVSHRKKPLKGKTIRCF